MLPMIITLAMVSSDQELLQQRTASILRLYELDDSIRRSAVASNKYLKDHSNQYNEVVSRSSYVNRGNYYNGYLTAQSNLNYALALRYHKRGRVNVYQAKQLIRKIQDLNVQLGYDIDDFNLKPKPR